MTVERFYEVMSDYHELCSDHRQGQQAMLVSVEVLVVVIPSLSLCNVFNVAPEKSIHLAEHGHSW